MGVPALSDFVLVHIIPILREVFDGILYTWFCGSFGVPRLKKRYLNTLCVIILWTIVSELLAFQEKYSFVSYIGIYVVLVFYRFLLALFFFKMERDKLIFVSVLYSTVWDIVQYLLGLIFGSVDMLMIPIELGRHLGLKADKVFLINRLTIAGSIVLSSTLGALIVWGYISLICREIKVKNRRFDSVELSFLLLPSIAAWLERRSIYNMMYPPDFKLGGDIIAIQNHMMSILIMLLLLIMIALNIVVYQKLTEAMQERAKREILERQNLDIKGHLEEVTKLSSNLKSFKHDMKNHISVLTQLSADIEGHEELKSYLLNMSKTTAYTDIRFFTGLATIDALLGSKEQQAKERLDKDFRIEADGLLFPKGLAIEEYDIAVIIGNAIDNAIEACEKYSGTPSIAISSEKAKNMLLIEVKNSISGGITINPQTGFPVSTKKNRYEHGIGFLNMQMTAEKYRGALDYNAENEIFTLTVMLQDIEPVR